VNGPAELCADSNGKRVGAVRLVQGKYVVLSPHPIVVRLLNPADKVTRPVGLATSWRRLSKLCSRRRGTRGGCDSAAQLPRRGFPGRGEGRRHRGGGGRAPLSWLRSGPGSRFDPPPPTPGPRSGAGPGRGRRRWSLPIPGPRSAPGGPGYRDGHADRSREGCGR
jgi:hypothetical protein